MNYLAHLYLSGNNHEIMIGNFIADHVKGKQIELFDEEIVKGIKLHRLIDEFTDTHKVVEQSKIRLRSEFGKYSPVIVDVFYDHYLAIKWEQYHHEDLSLYADNFYTLLNNNHHRLPMRTQQMIQYMIPQNWLLNYKTIAGINKTLTGMSKRTKFESKMDVAAIYLDRYYSEFENEFNEYFEELRTYVSVVGGEVLR
ncbi:MAG: ACP phosphodiesterase [Bacteroidota bacterium]|jgi:acyl carrier protein phosphodiesterase